MDPVVPAHPTGGFQEIQTEVPVQQALGLRRNIQALTYVRSNRPKSHGFWDVGRCNRCEGGRGETTQEIAGTGRKTSEKQPLKR